ncbi:rho GTPase-activating protein 26-like isoform X2 [Acanthaster planci]|uniref:Rho GTPase-activating protein 26-like isoform X2 n=1 Tax=Acanthaster planci TaxID=133434 RepID=A0A8B7XZ16_ACAPL|nr:rho GTPase-activating protein 26-like isoform X2 [Acanthaster planci]
MVLQPLEFSECYLDSPEFRESLHSHENELERTNKAIKELIRDGKALLNAARNLSKAQRAFSDTLISFNFECIGMSQTDDEIDISQSLKEFGRLIASIEDERDRMLEHAKDQLIVPLEAFRKDQIGSAKEAKKQFEKQTEKFCKSLDNHVGLTTKKKETSLQEADAALELERREFHRESLMYARILQEVQEKKKFEFVETLLGFMYSWLTFYHQGHEVAREFKPYMTELQLKLQNIRAGFDMTKQEAETLMNKMMEVRKPHEQLKSNKIQEGYLYIYEKRALGSNWVKNYCRYNKETKVLRMIPFVQTLPRPLTEDKVTVTSCTRRMTDSIEKRFCFDINSMEKPHIITLQAITERERTQWMTAMGGKEPIYINPAHISKKDDNLLNDIGFHFIKKCIEAIESRGLDDQGLYRVVGVNSKVMRLTSLCLDKRKPQNVNLSDSGEWEIKTITSALKNYFRNLPEPLMSFRLHDQLIAAAKQETKTLRVNDIHGLVHQLDEPNFEMLDLLIAHLRRVADHSEVNLMTVTNLGVCFGPTLMRPEEETMKAIMDIKFSNIVIEILIRHYEKIFKTAPDSGGRSQFRNVVPPSTSVLPNSTASSVSSTSSTQMSPRNGKQQQPQQVSRSDPMPTRGYHTQISAGGRDQSPRRTGEKVTPPPRPAALPNPPYYTSSPIGRDGRRRSSLTLPPPTSPPVSTLIGKFDTPRKKSIDDESLNYTNTPPSRANALRKGKGVGHQVEKAQNPTSDSGSSKSGINPKPLLNKKPEHLVLGLANAKNCNAQTPSPKSPLEGFVKVDYPYADETPPESPVSSPHNPLEKKDPGAKAVAADVGVAKGLHIGVRGIVGISMGLGLGKGNTSPAEKETTVKNGDGGKVESPRVVKRPMSPVKEGVKSNEGVSPKKDGNTDPSGDVVLRKNNGRKAMAPVLSRVSGVFCADQTNV